MEAYAEAKFALFEARGLKHAIVNVDDEWGVKLVQRLASRGLEVITYGCRPRPGGSRIPAAGGLGPRLHGSDIQLSEAGVRFHVDSDWGAGEVRAPVLGAFNVSNLLAVLATLLAQGIAFDDAVAALAGLEPVTGRLERVGGGSLPLVVIDYAHTPD